MRPNARPGSGGARTGAAVTTSQVAACSPALGSDGCQRPDHLDSGEDGEVTSTRVPVLLISGPVGVGKTTIASETGTLLREANIPHAIVDLAVIGRCWPPPADDPWNERLVHRNLAAMWRQFRLAGAARLVLARVLEDRSLLRPVRAAIPAADITVIQPAGTRAYVVRTAAPTRVGRGPDLVYRRRHLPGRVDEATRRGRSCGRQR
jgi:hypothetical protein